MSHAIRHHISKLFTSDRPLVLRHSPTQDITAQIQEQAKYLGCEVSIHHWQSHEARLLFHQAPQAMWTTLKNNKKLGLLVLCGFWRWNLYAQQVQLLLKDKLQNQRIILVEDCIVNLSTVNADVDFVVGGKYSDSLFKKSRTEFTSWIDSLLNPPEIEEQFETLNTLIEFGNLSTTLNLPEKHTVIFNYILNVLNFRYSPKDIFNIELLIEFLRLKIGLTIQFENMKDVLPVSSDSIKRYCKTLEETALLFSIDPWHRDVSRAIKADKKFYFHDWTLVPDANKRVENFVISVINSELSNWKQQTSSDIKIYHLKTKDNITIDLVICKDDKPIVAIDVLKKTETDIKKHNIIKKLGCTYFNITLDPFVWSESKMGRTISLSHFMNNL